jgi:hypothetical protein
VGSLANPVRNTARCEGACCILTSGVLWPVTAATCSSSCAMPAIFPPIATSSSTRGLEAWYNAFLTRLQQTEEDMTALDIIAMAACYSADSELAPFPFRLPFDLETCERLPDFWERWQANDPVKMVEDQRIQQALRSLKLLHFDFGSALRHQNLTGRHQQLLVALSVGKRGTDDGPRIISAFHCPSRVFSRKVLILRVPRCKMRICKG